MKLVTKYLVVILFLNSIVACSQSSSKSNTNMQDETIKNDELKILEVTRQLTELMIKGNTAAINRIVDYHFTLTHITGYVQSKEEWFAEIESERMKYYSYEEVKNLIKINGSNATFVGQNLLDARIWGSRNNWRLQQTMQLEKRNGKWIILKSVATTF